MGSMPTPNAVTATHIESLRDLLPRTKVLTPSNPGYEDSIKRWSRAAERPAAVCIVPTSNDEVAIAVKYAASNNLDLAVKGGGHSTSAASSTTGGVLIDLAGLRKVTVDTAKQLLHVQGGALWSDVDDAAWEHGLATVGGTVADTGVGGLTLGGGYGVLSGERGLTIDNVAAVTIVLANGEVVNANESENPDLYWAVLGAGQNFGVVTEFVLQAFPQKEMFMGFMQFVPTPESVERVVAAVNGLYGGQEGDAMEMKRKKALMLLGLVKPPPLGGKTMLIARLSYNGPEAEAREFFKPLSDIGPVADTTTMGPYPKVNTLVPSNPGMRASTKGSAYVRPLRYEFVMDVMEAYDDFIETCQDAKGTVVAWEAYDNAFIANSDKGCFANRGDHLNTLLMPVWTQAENDQKCRQFARDLNSRFKKELELHGVVRGKKGAVMLYGNFDPCDEVSKDIFGDNYERLSKIKAKYDPSNVFNKLFPITPRP